MSCTKFDKYPFEIIEFDEATKKRLKDELGFNSMVQVGPKKYVFQDVIRTPAALNILNFQAREDDVWVLGYMRSGTTMTQELIWLLKNDLDFESAAKTNLDHRFPSLENSVMWSKILKSQSPPNKTNVDTEEQKSIKMKYKQQHEILAESTKGRFIKTHWPISLAPPSIFEVGCKVIYCARNPKDVVVSQFNLQKFFLKVGIKDTPFPEFWKLFKDNLICSTPWFEHVKEGWAMRNNKNFLFLFFEDTKKDFRGTILKVAKFLDKELSETDIQKLEEHFKIENFRNNKSVNRDHYAKLGIADSSKDFIRKGQVGGWRDYFTPEMNAEAEEWIKENLKDSDLVLPKIN